MEQTGQEYKQRLAKLNELKEKGVGAFPNDFKPTATCAECIEGYNDMNKEELENVKESFSLAGRVMAIRSFGKAAFIHIQDRSGRLQLYLKKDTLGEETWPIAKSLDVGDIIGAHGTLFRTKTDELTLEAASLRLLSKGLRPLPEKWHGLKDVEARYRQRYLDLMVNPQAREVFIKRTEVIRLIREFLNSRDYVEVETPMMHHIAGGAAARPFITHHNTLATDLYLRIAPELYLKRLVIGGLERVFEINRNFRNEGVSTQHNPEFTMLEFYEAYATFEDMMVLTEEMISTICRELNSTTKISYQGQDIDFTPPWKRITVKDAILENSEATEEILAR